MKRNFFIPSFLFTVLLTYLGCALQEPSQVEDYNSIDSTYIKEWAENYIDSPIVGRDELELLPLNSYEEAIRIRNRDGWGAFDAIATFYLQEDRYLVQTVTQEQLPLNFRRSYTYKEFILTQRKWEEINNWLDRHGFWQSPFDLEPEVLVLDGDTYSIAAFSSERSHVTTWQLPENREHAGKVEILKLFEYLVLQSKRPVPCVSFYIDSIQQDSIYYAPRMPVWGIADSIAFDCDNCTTSVDEFGKYTISKLLDTSEYGNTNQRIDVRFFTPFKKVQEVDCKNFIGPSALDYLD